MLQPPAEPRRPLAGWPRIAREAARVRRRWAARRWPALLAAALALPVAVLAIVAVLDRHDEPFAGVLVSEGLIVSRLQGSGVPSAARAVPALSRLVAIDGEPVRTRPEVRALLARACGATADLTVEERGRRLTVRLPVARFGWRDAALWFGPLLSFGLVSVVAAITVGILRPQIPAAQAFLAQGVLTGLCALTGVAIFDPRFWSLVVYPHAITQGLFPASFLHLALAFPRPRGAVRRRPALVLLPYVPGLALGIWAAGRFTAVPRDLYPQGVIFAAGGLALLAAAGLFTLTWFREFSDDERSRMRPVVAGAVLAALVAAAAFLDSALGGGNIPNLAAAAALIFYLAVGYAIARHEFLDIDPLLRRTGGYAALTVVVSATYAVVLAALGPEPSGGVRWAAGVTFALSVVLLFEPLRRRVQGRVDRLFARGRLDYRRTIADLSAWLGTTVDLDEILETVARTLGEGLQLRMFAVALWLGEERMARRIDLGGQRLVDVVAPELDALRRVIVEGPALPWLVRRSDSLPEDPLRQLGGSLVVPLRVGTAIVGAFVLGRPRSGRLFAAEEVELAQALAAYTAVAASNAVAYRAVARANADLEGRIAARTQLLGRAYEDLKAAQARLVHSEKMVSLGVLVAGVAHEINNPVSFIVGGVEPLRSALDELTRCGRHVAAPAFADAIARAKRAVETIARGAERTTRIVRDLRAFSYASDGRTTPVDVHEGLEMCIRLLHSRWHGRITIHRDFGALPPVQASPDELGQLWMNLVANACDAIVGTGNIWIGTAPEGTTAVRVTIRDDGTGIPLELQPRVFDPFFTTKPQGTGTGLGLAVSHGIAARHGGRITFTSAPGAGSEFVVTLPLARRLMGPSGSAPASRPARTEPVSGPRP